MSYSPLAIKRRQVLGDLYTLCDSVEAVPVHLDNADGEKIGFADESLGHYADAYLFHLPEDVCKKLSTGHYIYSFDYDHSDPEAVGRNARIKLNYIFLTGRKLPEAVSRTSKKAAAALAALGAQAIVET
ncbi:MAG: hypothetical protein ACKVRN_10635 [Pyrinomonadaceae bacterium]